MPRQNGFFIFYTKIDTFIKYRNGQAALEYLVILGAIAAIVLISGSSFGDGMVSMGEKFYSNAAGVFKATAFKK